MQVAEIISQRGRGGRPGARDRLRRQQGRTGQLRAGAADQLAAGAGLPGHGAGHARAGPGLRDRRDRGRGRPLRPLLAAMADAHAERPRPRRAAAARCASCCRSGCGTASRRPPQEYRPARAGCTPSSATRRRSRTTTTCPTASTSGCSARRWPTPARSTRPATRRWRRRRRPSTSWWRRSSALRAGHAAARRRLRLGRHGHARRGRARRARRSASRCRATRPSGRRRRSSAGASATWPRSATCDYRDAPESQFDAVSSIGLTEHIGRANLPAYFAFLHDPPAAGRPAAQPLHHPAAHAAIKRLDPFINRYVFPDGELEAVGLIIVSR